MSPAGSATRNPDYHRAGLNADFFNTIGAKPTSFASSAIARCIKGGV
jgi:hypothetical protein